MLWANPLAAYKAHQSEIDTAIQRVLESGSYILGNEVQAFEQEFADYCSAEFAIGVGSGTDALIVALMACGVQAGHEVITVSHTSIATIAAIEAVGAKPVFVDIDPVFYTIDAGQIEQAITVQTRVIIPVHLYGCPIDMRQVVEIAKVYDLQIIEDCAQAHGTQVLNQHAGTLGDIGCYSFYPTKNLGAIGDGGMVITDTTWLARWARRVRQYGWDVRKESVRRGINSRLDEIQAAILKVKLRYLDRAVSRRRQIAQIYSEQLKDTGLILPSEPSWGLHSYHLYVVRSQHRNEKICAHTREAILG